MYTVELLNILTVDLWPHYFFPNIVSTLMNTSILEQNKFIFVKLF